MAVFTQVSPAEVQQLLRTVDPAAQLRGLEPIGAGIENTNYFVDAHLALPAKARPLAGANPDAAILLPPLQPPQLQPPQLQRLVLTLFETHSYDDVQLFGDILTWWAQQGFPVPAPVRTGDGAFVSSLQDKPAILSPRLPGTHALITDANHCKTLGTLLGRMHLIAPKAPFAPPVRRDLVWMRQAQERLDGHLPVATATHLHQEIEHYARHQDQLAACPQGLIHGDLFRDNVLFSNDSISGLIDFYHSAWDILLFDLAVVAIDWCRSETDSLEPDRLQALLEGYRRERPWQEEEYLAWPHLLRLAALRFWIARLLSRHLPGYQQQATAGIPTKDPAELERLLTALVS